MPMTAESSAPQFASRKDSSSSGNAGMVDSVKDLRYGITIEAHLKV